MQSSKHYQFRPKWRFTIATCLLIALFIKLGFWQLHRAQEKKILQQQFTAHLHNTPQPLTQISLNNAARFSQVLLSGHYDNEHTILLDNKIHQHQIGYEVVSPFILNDSHKMVLVNRGWIPIQGNRQQLPKISAVNGIQDLQGILYISPGKAFTLGQATDWKNTWPLRVEALEIPKIAGILQRSIYPIVILLDPNSPNGFVRDWQPVSMPAYKHLGYAVQWFTFALALIIIFLGLNLRRVPRPL